MSIGDIMRSIAAAGLMLACSSAAIGQATSSGLVVRTLAEVETKTREDDRDVMRLVPADRVVPGDEVLYTVEIRNRGAKTIPMPVVVTAVPAHVQYIADSAVGPGAEVSYSIDGGHTFGRAEDLRVAGPQGRMQTAKPVDYTHLCWQLHNTLKPHSVAYARFRARVK